MPLGLHILRTGKPYKKWHLVFLCSHRYPLVIIVLLQYFFFFFKGIDSRFQQIKLNKTIPTRYISLTYFSASKTISTDQHIILHLLHRTYFPMHCVPFIGNATVYLGLFLKLRELDECNHVCIQTDPRTFVCCLS